MSYLLDTNVCIDLMSSTSTIVRQAYEEAILEGEELCLSTVVLFELRYGVAKSSFPAASRHRLDAFLSTPLTLLSFDGEDAFIAGRVRAELERRKQPIGQYDTLIAAQAIARNLTLITANVREFARIKDLRWQDWAAKA